MRFPIRFIFLSIFIISGNLALSQNPNPFMHQDEIKNFKLNFYLDEMWMYDYFFFIDYDGFENFLVHNQKNNGNIRQQNIVVKKMNTANSVEKHLGERLEKFDENQRLILRKDFDVDSEQISTYTYNESNQLLAVQMFQKYIDGTKVEKSQENFKLKHYKDSIVTLEKDNEMTSYERSTKYFIKDNKVIKHVDYSEIMGEIYTSVYEYNDNGYNVNVRLGNLMQHFKKVTYYKDDMKVEIVYSEPEGVYAKVYYTFDTHGNVVQIDEFRLKKDDVYLKEPQVKAKYIVNYKYDSKGNWVEMHYKNVMKEKEFLFSRTINYY